MTAKVRLLPCPDCDGAGTIPVIRGDEEDGRENCPTCRGTCRVVVWADGNATYADPNEVELLRDLGNFIDETAPTASVEVPPIGFVEAGENALECSLTELLLTMPPDAVEWGRAAYKCGWRECLLWAWRELKGGAK